MVDSFLIIGIAVAAFVGFNIGGSSTSVAFGPAVGAGLISKVNAAAIMLVFVFFGGWTVGRNVVETMGGDIVPASMFTPEASVAILLFIGVGILVANVFGVPVPTSMTAVGAIAGFGLATGILDWETMGMIVSWWLVTPIIAFWVGAAIGRYLYVRLNRYFAVEQSEGPLLSVERAGPVLYPALGPNTTPRELATSALVVAIGCYLGFSAGASNVANAVAPLVGSGAIGLEAGIILATLAIGLGGFTIARRTLDSVGNGLTELPLLAALIVAATAATITTVLSWMGIPISLVMSTIMCIVGLGWGRASRVMTLREMAEREDTQLSVDALTMDTPGTDVRIDEDHPEDVQNADELFDPSATARFISFWIIGPSAGALLSYAFFVLVPFVG